jgi:hypothetical protein
LKKFQDFEEFFRILIFTEFLAAILCPKWKILGPQVENFEDFEDFFSGF